MAQTNGNSNGGPPKQIQRAKKAGDVSPKADATETLKERFLAVLKTNGGNVSGALNTTGLKRNAAYDHFKADKEFADRWLEALEISNDELFIEARRRAVKGELRYSIDKRGRRKAYREKSDTLLIFLMKQGEAQKKWRTRIVQTGNLALETVRSAGTAAGITEDQIKAIQDDMTQKFDKISLI